VYPVLLHKRHGLSDARQTPEAIRVTKLERGDPAVSVRMERGDPAVSVREPGAHLAIKYEAFFLHR